MRRENLSTSISHRINSNYSTRKSPSEWGDAVVRRRPTGVRIGSLCDTPDSYNHRLCPNYLANALPKFALVSWLIAAPKSSINCFFFRQELEQHWSYIFSWSWKFYRKLILMSQLSKPRRVDSWENSSECAQFPVEFDSVSAKPWRTIFCWDRMACFLSAKDRRAGIFKILNAV